MRLTKMVKIKIFLALVLIFGQQQVYSQKEIDLPVLKLDSPCYRIRKQIAFDSTVNIITRIEVFSVDPKDHCVPAAYCVTKTQLEPVPYYLLAFAQCDDNEGVYRMGFRSPDACLYYQKRDANHAIQSPEFNTGENVKIDSIQLTKIDCAEYFYQIENDTVQADTIYSKYDVDDDYSMDNQLIWYCEYYYERKHGKEMVYYSVKDVQGICLTGTKPMVEREGYWRDGKKNSWWIYYLPDGEIEKIEKYRKGKLKKSIVY
jgi:hypothetical protein